MNVVLDAGALIGIERQDRRVAGLIELARRAGAGLVTVAPVVAQVWRDGARQATLARWLPMMEVHDTSLAQAKAAGELLAVSSTSDVVDALLALVALPGDHVLTSDPDDVRGLIEHRALPVTVISV